ncbi:TonB-dependent receptor [Aquimarina sp. 2201CG5-10]|uniref:SusC/RagA family TonB-linked outer membrane protein n=1 Tax=Aquimarina callyspongiae TaxID=3098150 RepID=UPI002AB57F80|nr:TonB-dependent receptor [Aquimarina sp. 2201CG5-10]MDY8134174.1 TonB-dependent receptor [Aquimarina sp. 2201CG5-10]
MKKVLGKIILFCLLMLFANVKAQEKNISGAISDAETGVPLPGATILIKGTSKGVTSDFDGIYTIKVNENDILIVSFLGYTTQEIPVIGQTNIDISLVADSEIMDEILVVGFGTQKRSNISGSVTTVKLDEILEDRPLTNAAQALQGVAAGLQVITASGQPGNSQTSLRLRGFGSINGGGDPLVLVDNVEMEITDINPNDIKNVTILKDAAASSIYGARAAFGVILITTKKPDREQKIKFDFKTSLSISRPQELTEKASVYEFVSMLDFIGVEGFFTNQSTTTWLDYLEQYRLNPGSFPANGRILDDDGFYYSLTEQNPIDQHLNNQGILSIHDFSFSGGSKKSSYRVSVGYSDQDGIIVTNKDRFTRYNINTFLDSDITTNLKSTTNILYRKSDRSNPVGNFLTTENAAVYLPTGNFTLDDGRVLPFDSPDNLERLLPHPTRDEDVIRIFERLTYNPFKDVTVNGEFTYEKGNWNTQRVDIQLETVNRAQFVPNNSNPLNTSVSKTFREFQNNAFNLYINYSKDFKETHTVNALVGYNRESGFQNGISVNRTNLLSTDLPAINTAIGPFGGGDFYRDWAVLGYFGRLQYNYKEKYFLEGNIRHDGSSRFPKNSRYGTFPSFSAAWNLKKEKFIENADWISLLKLRGSWGEVGNQKIFERGSTSVQEFYPAIAGYEPRETWLLNDTGERYITIQPGQLISSNLTWETVQTTNLGLDAAFLNNRLATTVEVYERKTLDMLLPGAQLPDVLGTSAPDQNAADLRTRGWELEISWRDKIGDFSYGLNFNVSNNETEITRFDNPAGLLSQRYVGQIVGEIWGYVTEGYYTIDDFVDGTIDPVTLTGVNRQLREGVVGYESGNIPYPGDIKYVDLDGDGIITDGTNTLNDSGDQKIIGNDNRRYIYGFYGTAAYKGFDMSFALSGVGKRDRVLGGDKFWPYLSQFDYVYKHQLDYWTPDNQDAFYPRIYGDNTTRSGDRGNYGENRRTQTKYLANASYLRINNITIGYSLPQSLLEKNKLTKARIYLSGENLHTFKSLPKGIHPDQNISQSVYPRMKNFAFGMQLAF